MDCEIANIVLNVSQLSALSGVHRQTVALRLRGVKPVGGNESNLKLYRLIDVLTALMQAPTSQSEGNDPNKMKPADRRAWYQSEQARIELEKEMRTLIPANEVLAVYAAMVKSVTKVLETLPDLLERDVALAPQAVMMVQNTIDNLRNDLYKANYQAAADAINGIESDITNDKGEF
ncbi:DNA breaking-rejoining protein [Yersinia kristensenii]|nr:DNA breaking-rejoining protein [Yersinia kristensenii]